MFFVSLCPLLSSLALSALNTGQECELLMLEGTFSIVYRAVEYFTPVEVFAFFSGRRQI